MTFYYMVPFTISSTFRSVLTKRNSSSSPVVLGGQEVASRALNIQLLLHPGGVGLQHGVHSGGPSIISGASKVVHDVGHLLIGGRAQEVLEHIIMLKITNGNLGCHHMLKPPLNLVSLVSIYSNLFEESTWYSTMPFPWFSLYLYPLFGVSNPFSSWSILSSSVTWIQQNIWDS